MKLSAKLFLETEGRYILGPGRLKLLEATSALGSLHKAAQSLGMSYRWAWGRLRDSEKALGFPLLTQEGHGGRGKPKILTPEAQELLKWFSQLESQLDITLTASLAQCPKFLNLSGD
ncbi:MAG: winged helix-turn-helix domain-containing protein [Candidatus Adiutrix sp.]